MRNNDSTEELKRVVSIVLPEEKREYLEKHLAIMEKASKTGSTIEYENYEIGLKNLLRKYTKQNYDVKDYEHIWQDIVWKKTGVPKSIWG